MQRGIGWLLALMIASFMLSGCQLIPEEETMPTRPILHSYEEQGYTTETVMRGDLVSTVSVSCWYKHAKEEHLSFSVGGAYISKVYVTEGQQVKAGQLLAELEQDNLQENIASLEYQLRLLEQQNAHLLEDRQLDIKKIDITLEDLRQRLEQAEDPLRQQLLTQIEQQERQRENVMETYAGRLQSGEDSIYLMGLRLADAKETLKSRQIIAGIDGTVTFVDEVTEGTRSVKGQTFINISDLNTAVFTVTGDNAQYFTTGQDVLLTCQGKELAVYVADPSDYDTTEEKATAYLKLKQPEPTLQEGDSGSVLLTLDQRRDVLYVDASAVKTADGETFVFVLDENGLRTTKTVTTGLTVKGFTEITEGLSEGDAVIVD